MTDVSCHNPSAMSDELEDNNARSNEHSHSGERGNPQIFRKTLLPKQRKDFRTSSWSLGLATYTRKSRRELVVGELEKRDRPTSTEPESKLESQVVEWRLAPATWLKVSGISLQWTMQSWGNWQYSLTSFRVVDHGHPGFFVCVEGNIPELIRLLSARTITLSDIDPQGRSLLHVSEVVQCPCPDYI